MKTFTEPSGTFSRRTFPPTTQLDLSSQLDLLVLCGKEGFQCCACPIPHCNGLLLGPILGPSCLLRRWILPGGGFCYPHLGRQGGLQGPGAGALLCGGYLVLGQCTRSHTPRFPPWQVFF